MKLVLLFFLGFGPSWAQDAPAAPEAAAGTHDVAAILNGMEKNLRFASSRSHIKMVISTARRTREIEMVSYARGSNDASVEYLAPAREKGTRMLRLGDELWMYMPSVERTQKISGHMLRQGLSGSDMSYEDLTTSTAWEEQYDGVISGIETYAGTEHYKVELTAKDDSVTYPRRVIWVDTKTLIPTQQELYALSGMLVKTWGMTDVRAVEGAGVYPHKMRVEDKLKAGSATEIITLDIQVGVALQEEIFTRGWLERG